MKRTLNRYIGTLAIGLVGVVAACEPTMPSIRVTPINAYRSYGEYHPVAVDEAVVKKAATIEAGGKDIRVFQEALPSGIVMQGGVLGVEKGSGHKLIGKYVYSAGENVSKDSLVLRVKQMCIATGANAAMVIFLATPNEHQDQAQGIEAVLMNYVQDSPAR